MKIAFDAKRALNNVAGLGQYSRTLLNACLRDFPQHNYHFYTPKVKDFLQQEIQGNYQLHFPGNYLHKKISMYWRSYGITNELIQDKIEVYHGLSNELPLNIHVATSVKKIVTIHDVIFLKHKDQYSAIDRKIYDYKTRHAAKHADAIATISHETKQDLIRYYGIKENKIEVIYPSCAPIYYKEVDSAQKEKIRLKYKLPERYILNVSSFFARKNHRAIVEAMDLLKGKTDLQVVFIGGQGNIKAEIVSLIKNKKLEDRFHLLEGVSNEEMPALYQQASMFVYPSFFEGFGLPIMEAMCSKIPVITTKGGCFEEVGGPSTLYINPADPVELSEAILQVVSNEVVRKTMISQGKLYAAGMKDEIFARKMMALYEGGKK